MTKLPPGLKRCIEFVYLSVYRPLPKAGKMLVTKLRFLLVHGYWPDIRNPRTLSEKIQHRKFFTNEPLFTIGADRLAARDYVASKVGAKYLIDLLAVFDRAEDFDPAGLEGEYIVKATHDSGTWIMVQSGETPDVNMIRRKMTRALSRDFAELGSEYWYAPIPRRVVVERLLRNKAGELPDDYKFHVFKDGGTTRLMLQFCHDRHRRHRNCFYAESGEQLDMAMLTPYAALPPPRPENYDEMVRVAKALAEDFSYVRVDLYNVDGQIYFGELTFSHLSGLIKVNPREMDFRLGQYWDISAESTL